MKFYIAKGEGEYKEVWGKEIVLPGFENFKFFQHKSESGFGYSISEATTGLLVASGGTLKEAKQIAIKQLQAHAQNLPKIIEDARKAGHVSPLYREREKVTINKPEPEKEKKEKEEVVVNKPKEKEKKKEEKVVVKNKVYQIVVKNLLNRIGDDSLKWQPMRKIDGVNMPYNVVSKRPYTGINRIITYYTALMFGDWRFLTYNQLRNKGGRLRKGKGNRGIPIIFYKEKDICYKCVNRDVCDEETKQQVNQEFKESGEISCPEEICSDFVEDLRVNPLMSRFYTVYNIKETTLGDDEKVVDAVEGKAGDFRSVIRTFLLNTGAVFKKGMKPYYNLINDTIFVPDKKNYDSISVFYHDIFHELAHWTGKEGRLSRPSFKTLKDRKEEDTTETAAEKYAFEELIAEISSLFLCMKFNIVDEKIFNNSVAYLKSWLKKLRDDPSLIVRAAAQAEKVASYLEGLQERKQEQVA